MTNVYFYSTIKMLGSRLRLGIRPRLYDKNYFYYSTRIERKNTPNVTPLDFAGSFSAKTRVRAVYIIVRVLIIVIKYSRTGQRTGRGYRRHRTLVVTMSHSRRVRGTSMNGPHPRILRITAAAADPAAR